ncbi:MAG: molybdopterin-dependent oxidoreductase [Desulfobacterales bacterium]
MAEDPITIIPTGGCYDCGGRCVLKVHVKDGKMIRVETDDGEGAQYRACAKGRALRKQVYSPHRLLYPAKRAGERGEGKFDRISWNEALDTVASELSRIKKTYGSEAIMVQTLAGSSGMVHSSNQSVRRFLKSYGGYSSTWGDVSGEGAIFDARTTYGTLTNANDRDDLMNSRLILLWGIDPVTSLYGTNTPFQIKRAKEAGAKVIVVDPRFTESAAILGDEWIPIRPGTDTAMLVAMAYVMIHENIHDQEFLENYTTGFNQYRNYIMGEEDGIPKTPQWAFTKTEVPAERIVSLARQYATLKPGALIAGMAPGRNAFGEQFHRAVSTLAAMTGNVGIHGGNAAGFERPPVIPMVPEVMTRLFEGGSYDQQKKRLDTPGRKKRQPHTSKVWDAILKGKAGGYPADYKMAYIAFNNPLNQWLNTNKGVQALKKLEFIVVHEQFMTATARFADILLPVNTVWERNDFARPWMGGPYFIYQNKVIEPLGESKTDIEICRELAGRLNIKDPFFDLPEEEMIRRMMDLTQDMPSEIPDYQKFIKEGIHKIRRSEPPISFKEQIENPKDHPFPTISGKIEIYSQILADLDDPEIPPIPKHMAGWESLEDPLIERLPLQLITFHPRFRGHSSFYTNTWVNKIKPQSVYLNSQDAKARGIADGDMVRVFNDRGETIIPASVGEVIMPGVVAIAEGAWYSPDEKGRDRGGCPNVLTRDDCSPGGAFPFNGCLVQAEKFLEEE